MNRAVAELYAPDIITLATKPDTPRIPFKHEVFEEAVEWLHKEGRYSADMLADPHAHRLIEETFNALDGAIGASITQEMPEEMTYALRNNAFIFSGFKTHRTLSEVGLELTDEEGNLKPYAKFLEDVKRIDSKYNDTYLYAEYNHAVHTTQMAVKWQDFVRDGDEYNLQYRTAGDERVREAHIALDGVTLPPSDKFWDRYLPPNGWNCRCTVVQVLREDFPLSDSEEAIKRGDENTQSIKQQMFRFNPGKTLEVFPPKHPYLPKGCGSCPLRSSLKLANSTDGALSMCLACEEISKLAVTDGRKRAEEYMPIQANKVLRDNLETGSLHQANKPRKRLLNHCHCADEIEAAIYFWNNPHLLGEQRISPLGENKDMSDPKVQKNIARKKQRGVQDYIEYRATYRGARWIIKTERHTAGFEQFYWLKKED